MSAPVGNLYAANSTGGNSPSAQRAAEKFSSESELETAISAAADVIARAPTREERIAACTVLSALHAQRSPGRVRFMERVRGLR